jgi:hypothetical protein
MVGPDRFAAGIDLNPMSAGDPDALVGIATERGWL